MKTTGISRRIDKAGRVVIPVEIRTTLGIKNGDAIEIFTHDNEVVLRKYDAQDSLGGLVDRLYDGFTNASEAMDRKTAERIRWHINALRELTGG